MSDNFRCELTFPREALSHERICEALQRDLHFSDKETDALRNGSTDYHDLIGPDFDDPGLIVVCDVHAQNGEIEETERALFEAGFAFNANANAEGYMEIEPEFRYWRPGMSAPTVLPRTEGGDAYTLTSALREAIARTASMADPVAVRAEFERLADVSDPAITPIEGYASEVADSAA